MTVQGKPQPLRLGFLTAVEVEEKGYVGGLLVTNANGRPLEFQCTLPVRPNATQEILYGPTLAPYILGELIGGTLIEKAGVKPQLVLTDHASILELRNHIEFPVGLVLSPEEAIALAEAPNSASADSPACEVKLGRQTIRIHGAHQSDRDKLRDDARQIPADADLCEPFERVREALQETLRAGALR